MSADTLILELRRLGVRLRAEHDRLVVDAPRGVLTDEMRAELKARKPDVLRLVQSTPSLADVAADRLPSIRFTIRESGDTQQDFDLVGRVRRAIEEFQPGGNHIFLTIVTLDGRRVVVEWRALAERGLRVAIGRLLADAALQKHAKRAR